MWTDIWKLWKALPCDATTAQVMSELLKLPHARSQVPSTIPVVAALCNRHVPLADFQLMMETFSFSLDRIQKILQSIIEYWYFVEDDARETDRKPFVLNRCCCAHECLLEISMRQKLEWLLKNGPFSTDDLTVKLPYNCFGPHTCLYVHILLDLGVRFTVPSSINLSAVSKDLQDRLWDYWNKPSLSVEQAQQLIHCAIRSTACDRVTQFMTEHQDKVTSNSVISGSIAKTLFDMMKLKLVQSVVSWKMPSMIDVTPMKQIDVQTRAFQKCSTSLMEHLLNHLNISLDDWMGAWNMHLSHRKERYDLGMNFCSSSETYIALEEQFILAFTLQLLKELYKYRDLQSQSDGRIKNFVCQLIESRKNQISTANWIKWIQQLTHMIADQ
jgi:hypothetical protein